MNKVYCLNDSYRGTLNDVLHFSQFSPQEIDFTIFISSFLFEFVDLSSKFILLIYRKRKSFRVCNSATSCKESPSILQLMASNLHLFVDKYEPIVRTSSSCGFTIIMFLSRSMKLQASVVIGHFLSDHRKERSTTPGK